MKRNSFIKFIFSSILFLPLLMGCNQSESTIKETVTIAKETYYEILGDTFQIDASFTSSHKNVFLSYTSSDTSVAKIDNDGYVTSYKKGSAQITVSSGYAEATCNVEIGYGLYQPVIEFNGLESRNLSLTIGDTYDLSGFVLFNGKSYQNPLVFDVVDTTIASMDNDTITAKAVGNTVVKVNSNFGGEQLHQVEISLEVKDKVQIALYNENTFKQLDAVHLFSVAEFEEKQYVNEIKLSTSIIENGLVVQKDKYSISLVDEEGVVSYNPTTNILKGNKIGKATIVISYTSNDNAIYEKRFDVVVSSVVGVYEGPLFEVDLTKGTFPVDSIFSSFSCKEIKYASSLDLAKEFEVKKGNVFGLELNETKEQSIIVYNDSVGYIVSFRAYTKIITSFDDLSFLRMTSSNQVINGYVVLGNNIDCNDKTLPYHYFINDKGQESSFITYGYASMAQFGFRGIFDGRGYTIKNINVCAGGLFGIIGSGASISNLGLEINLLKGNVFGGNAQGLATYINNASISNLYININNSTAGVGFAGSLAYVMHNKNVISNTVIYTTLTNPAFSSTYSGYGAMSARIGDGESLPTSSSEFLKDTYFISALPLSHFTDSKVATTKYKYDVLGWEENLTGIIPNAKHYATVQTMKDADNSFASFSETYWTISDKMIYWKNA